MTSRTFGCLYLFDVKAKQMCYIGKVIFKIIGNHFSGKGSLLLAYMPLKYRIQYYRLATTIARKPADQVGFAVILKRLLGLDGTGGW